jgi:hypothetical protein
VVTIGVLVVLGLYQFVLAPLISDSERLELDKQTALSEFGQYNRTIHQSKDAKNELKLLTDPNTDSKSGPKLGRDASAAETVIYSKVRDWAQEAGMSPPSVQPTRTAEKEKDFYKLTFRVQGGGTMQQISQFLYYIKMSSAPVQINELQITSNKENTDDLKMALTLSTIYLPPDADKSKQPVTPVARAGEVE